VGINLNINNACNWRCVYCQVPNLSRGAPPPIDLDHLESELDTLLNRLLHGDFMQRHVPEGLRILKDIAFSGNGEPTTAREFPEVLLRVEAVLKRHHLLGKLPVVLITNGSQMHRPRILAALGTLSRINGEVWFKLDAATRAASLRINNSAQDPERVFQRLTACATRCRTWVQTCVFAQDGNPPSAAETEAWLAMLHRTQTASVPLAGVLLYGIARPSLQPEAPRLSAVPPAWFEHLVLRIKENGLEVRASP